MRTSTWISLLACTALVSALPLASAQEKPAPLWPQEGYGALRSAAAKAKTSGSRLLLGLSGGDH